MLKFRYSMQGILDLKYRLEDQAKGVFAAAKIRVEEEQERLDLLKNERLSYEEGLQKIYYKENIIARNEFTYQ